MRLIYDGKVTLVNARHNMNRYARAKENRALREWAGWAARETSVGEWPAIDPTDLEVDVHFLLTTRTKRLPDADACAGAAKAVLDGIVDAGIIADDTPDIVRTITYHAPEHTGTDSLRVLIKPAVRRGDTP